MSNETEFQVGDWVVVVNNKFLKENALGKIGYIVDIAEDSVLPLHVSEPNGEDPLLPIPLDKDMVRLATEKEVSVAKLKL